MACAPTVVSAERKVSGSAGSAGVKFVTCKTIPDSVPVEAHASKILLV